MRPTAGWAGSRSACAQRLGLATALLHGPEILILDEPANGPLFNSIGPYLPFTAVNTLAGSRLGGGGFGFSGSSSASALPFAATAVLVAGLAIILSLIASRTSLRHDIAR